MLPPDFLSSLPDNLSRQAAKDLVSVLRRSATEFGILAARRARDRILALCRAIQSGKAVGHRRFDVEPRTPTLFINTPPWVIAYNPETGQVTRIIHGIRDFPRIFD